MEKNEEESYILFKDGDEIYAQNGTMNGEDFTGNDIGMVTNRAINLLTDGGLIYIKEGFYRQISSIMIRPKISLIGAGRGTVIQRVPYLPIKMITFNITDPYPNGKQPNTSQIIGNFSLDGNFREGSSDWAIFLGDKIRHNPDFIVFENIEIYDSDGIGINKGCYWNKFNNVNIWNPPNKAIDLSLGSDFPNLNTFSNCRFTGNSNGIGVILHGSNNNFLMCDFSGWKVALTGSGYRHTLMSPWFENNNIMIDTTNIYQLLVINPRTSFIDNDESGRIIEIQPITWIGSSSWKYGDNDNTVDSMISTSFIDSLSMPFRSFQLGAARLVWSAIGSHENTMKGSNSPIEDNSAYRGKSIPLNSANDYVKTDNISIPSEPPGLQHSTYIAKVRLRLNKTLLSQSSQLSTWGLFSIKYFDGNWNSLEYLIIPEDFPDPEWYEISTQFSTNGWNQFFIEISKKSDNIQGYVDIIQIEPGNIIGFYTPLCDIRPNGKIVLKDEFGNIKIILNRKNNQGFIGMFDSVSNSIKYAYIKAGKWIISDVEP